MRPIDVFAADVSGQRDNAEASDRRLIGAPMFAPPPARRRPRGLTPLYHAIGDLEAEFRARWR